MVILCCEVFKDNKMFTIQGTFNTTLLNCPTTCYVAITTITLTKTDDCAAVKRKTRVLRIKSSNSQRQND